MRQRPPQLSAKVGLSNFLPYNHFGLIIYFCVAEMDLDRLEQWLDQKRRSLSELQSSTLALLARFFAEIIQRPNGKLVRSLYRMVWRKMSSSYVFPGQQIPKEYLELLELLPNSRNGPHQPHILLFGTVG
jgi:hypothetical protein